MKILLVGRYRAIYALVALSFAIFGHCSVEASGWLPAEGKYKFSAFASIMDHKSASLSEAILEQMIKIHKKIVTLKEEKNSPTTHLLDKNMLQNHISELEHDMSRLELFQSHQVQSTDLEYGVQNDQSIGLKMHRGINEFNSFSTRWLKQKNITFYYKWKFWEKDNYKITLSPSATLSSKNIPTNSQSISLWLALENKKAKYSVLSDYGIAAGNIRDGKKKNNNPFYEISLSKIIKFPNGYMLQSFSKYSIFKNPYQNYKYLYEQLSIAKEYRATSQSIDSFTLQLGHFWHYKLHKPRYTFSGITFSVMVGF